MLKKLRGKASNAAWFLSGSESKPTEPRCYRKSIKAYLKQAIDGEYEPVNISGGMELNLIKQATFGDTVSDEIVAKLGEVREQLINKEIAVFEGPIYAQDGSVMFEDGYRPTIEEINVIDQLVQGVKGSMN